ncbi:hypothetical protein ANN_17648, partial [Periplaneta americana]
IYYGITPRELRLLAFDIAERNEIPRRFSKEKRIVGKKWYYTFMRRHPELNLRQPESTSFARAKRFNKENKARKVLAFKGKRAVGSTASGERGFSTTPVCCTSVACQYVQPLIIYKHSRSAKGLEDGTPPGTIFAYYPESGYINKGVFVRRLRHFIDTVHSSKEGELLLLPDGHSTHTRNLDALDIARENGVIRTHKPEVVTQFYIPRLFGKAYGLAATTGTAVNGFTKTVVWPVNRDVFKDCHFVAAMQFETDDVLVIKASTIEPFNEEIPEPNRSNTVNPEKEAIGSGSQDSLESLSADAATLTPKLQVSLGEIFSYTKENLSRKKCK